MSASKALPTQHVDFHQTRVIVRLRKEGASLIILQSRYSNRPAYEIFRSTIRDFGHEDRCLSLIDNEILANCTQTTIVFALVNSRTDRDRSRCRNLIGRNDAITTSRCRFWENANDANATRNTRTTFSRD